MNIERELLKCFLLEKFKESSFRGLQIKQMEDGSIGVNLSGQAFGVIGALVAAVKAVSESYSMPVHSVIEMLSLGVDCTEKRESRDLTEDEQEPEIFKMFESFIKNDLEEGEE